MELSEALYFGRVRKKATTSIFITMKPVWSEQLGKTGQPLDRIRHFEGCMNFACEESIRKHSWERFPF